MEPTAVNLPDVATLPSKSIWRDSRFYICLAALFQVNVFVGAVLSVIRWDMVGRPVSYFALLIGAGLGSSIAIAYLERTVMSPELRRSFLRSTGLLMLAYLTVGLGIATGGLTTYFLLLT